MINQVRTRFAPSPTGFLHVGGLRTALYNYLFAQHHDGKMVLRIEDTDRTRFVEGAIQNLIATLKSMNIHYQEGPDKRGPFGPYKQSERLSIYKQHAQILIEHRDAYYCFCTPERLENIRRKQETNKQQPKYDGICRQLSYSAVEEKLDKGLSFVIRLKMPQEGEKTFHDLIRGNVSIQNALSDDQILIKSDGFPTYHLANVVDDHQMQISHVIRGEEWLLSVPKHLRLYEAFGWDPPKMAHLPLLLNPDRSKLSKRQGDVAVEEFLNKGYLPEALNNFVALLGWNPGTDQEIFSMKELIQQFSLERVNKSGAIFDLQKLNWMNSYYIRELSPEKRNDFLIPFLKKAGYDISDPQKTVKIIEVIHKRISFGDEVEQQATIFFGDNLEVLETEAKEILRKPISKDVLRSFLNEMKTAAEIDIEVFKNIMKTVQQQTGVKKDDLWMPIRVALTGVTHGPELPMVIEIFGKKKIQNYVQQALRMSEMM
jgi:nondiscriminating glutamyl-tRNA synthetase